MASRVLLYCLLIASAAAAAAQQQLCADINTASSGPTTSVFQSVGACTATCGGQYAYAVLRNTQCWCSNYRPNASTQRNRCNAACPGYPYDVCGGSAGLYSYVLLNEALVLGTKGSPVKVESTSDGSPETTPSSPPSSSRAPTSDVGSSTQLPLTTATTIGGLVRTVTVMPSEIMATSTPESVTVQGSGINAATVVGIVIGCVAAIALAVTGTVCLILYKKRSDRTLIDDASARGSEWDSKGPFAAVYGQRNRSGSIETILQHTEQCLRITNPDPPEK